MIVVSIILSLFLSFGSSRLSNEFPKNPTENYKQFEDEWESFVTKFNKNYTNPDDRMQHSMNYRRNKEFIDLSNEAADLGLCCYRHLNVTADADSKIFMANEIEDNTKDLFEKFKIKYNRIYSVNEEKVHYQTFKTNVMRIMTHNIKILHYNSFKQDINQFTDMAANKVPMGFDYPKNTMERPSGIQEEDESEPEDYSARWNPSVMGVGPVLPNANEDESEPEDYSARWNPSVMGVGPVLPNAKEDDTDLNDLPGMELGPVVPNAKEDDTDLNDLPGMELGPVVPNPKEDETDLNDLPGMELGPVLPNPKEDDIDLNDLPGMELGPELPKTMDGKQENVINLEMSKLSDILKKKGYYRI